MSSSTSSMVKDLDDFALNQQTVRQWSLPRLAAGCAAAGVRHVGLWREPVRAYGLRATARLLRQYGLSVSSLCRGGFLTAPGAAARTAALDENRAAVDEAAALGAGVLVIVAGGLPSGCRDLAAARRRVTDALAELVPYARAHGVRLAVEPLHPMYASDRCVVSTLCQALDIAEQFTADAVGVVVDTYHLWWDDTVAAQLARAGQGGRVALFQLADWVTPLPDGVLVGRGQLGDGCVDLRWFRHRVAAAGYRGPAEVEIFNSRLWSRDGGEVLAEVLNRYRRYVLAPRGVDDGPPTPPKSYKG
ncbi:sugar phosphate isomerase/epimerase family protein [Streptomyces gamaensis]|uniref:Sugar phosphate isomerase/epimerase family protein n=1 Tax=Streptomyces gamaensis TaxID=1763542 RepID=A0ABW0YUS1_9ACTN